MGGGAAVRRLGIASAGMLGGRAFPEVVAEAFGTTPYQQATQHAVPVPATIRAGDLALAFTGGHSGTEGLVINPPDGWTRVDLTSTAALGVALDVRQLGASEPAEWVWTVPTIARLSTRVVIARNASPQLGDLGGQWNKQHTGTATDYEWYDPAWIYPDAPALALAFVHAHTLQDYWSTIEPPITAPANVLALTQQYIHEGRLYRTLAGTEGVPAGTWDAGAWGMPTNRATVRASYTVALYPS